MQFEEQYPNKPPQVKFISQMFHPNVYATGELCLDILQNRWSPTYDVAAVLTSIQRSVIPSFRLEDSAKADKVCSVSSTTPTPDRQPTSKRRTSTRTTGRSTPREYERLLRKAGRTRSRRRPTVLLSVFFALLLHRVGGIRRKTFQDFDSASVVTTRRMRLHRAFWCRTVFWLTNTKGLAFRSEDCRFRDGFLHCQ